jgi:hypothetical protein
MVDLDFFVGNTPQQEDILMGDVSVPACRIEIRRSSPVIGAGLVDRFYNSIGECHEPIAGSQQRFRSGSCHRL